MLYQVVVVLKGVMKIGNPSPVTINQNISLFLQLTNHERLAP